jgi:hypothetical protein
MARTSGSNSTTWCWRSSDDPPRSCHWRTRGDHDRQVGELDRLRLDRTREHRAPPRERRPGRHQPGELTARLRAAELTAREPADQLVDVSEARVVLAPVLDNSRVSLRRGVRSGLVRDRRGCRGDVHLAAAQAACSRDRENGRGRIGRAGAAGQHHLAEPQGQIERAVDLPLLIPRLLVHWSTAVRHSAPLRTLGHRLSDRR